MSCTGTSFVQRHLCFRVTTSLLTVLPQLAHLALLQASIRMVFFTCMNPTAPQASWPDVTGRFSCREKTAFAPLLFCFPDSPLAPFPPPPLFHSITDPVWMSCPRISQGFFLSQKKSMSSPHWTSPLLWPPSVWGRACRRKALVGTRASTLLRPRNTCGFTVLWGALLLLPLPKVLHVILQSFKQV